MLVQPWSHTRPPLSRPPKPWPVEIHNIPPKISTNSLSPIPLSVYVHISLFHKTPYHLKHEHSEIRRLSWKSQRVRWIRGSQCKNTNDFPRDSKCPAAQGVHLCGTSVAFLTQPSLLTLPGSSQPCHSLLSMSLSSSFKEERKTKSSALFMAKEFSTDILTPGDNWLQKLTSVSLIFSLKKNISI